MVQFYKISSNLINSPGFTSLSPSAQLILFHSIRYFYDDNRRHTFTYPFSTIHKHTNLSKDCISRSIAEILKAKYWFLESKGSMGNSAVYRHNRALFTTVDLPY